MVIEPSCMNHVPLLVAQCGNALSHHALSRILESFCTVTGFRWFALWPRSQRDNKPGTPMPLTNFPVTDPIAWLTANVGEGSPIALAGDCCATSVVWNELPSLIELTPSQRNQIGRFLDVGLHYGVTIPVRIPGTRGALVSFATDESPGVCPSARYAAELLASHSYEALLRISGETSSQDTRRKLPLTGRQAECLKLVAQGKSDWEVGQILGLSDQTVHDHVETVRRRYGVRRRIQLVIHVLHDGLLSFPEVI